MDESRSQTKHSEARVRARTYISLQLESSHLQSLQFSISKKSRRVFTATYCQGISKQPIKDYVSMDVDVSVSHHRRRTRRRR